MEKLIDLLKKNQKIVGLGAAAAIAAGAIYYLTKGTTVAEETTKGNDSQPKSLSEYEKRASSIISKINVRNIQNNKSFDLNTISQILEYSLDLAEEEYVEYTLKNRDERRKFMKSDFENYEKLIIDYNDQIELILKKA